MNTERQEVLKYAFCICTVTVLMCQVTATSLQLRLFKLLSQAYVMMLEIQRQINPHVCVIQRPVGKKQAFTTGGQA